MAARVQVPNNDTPFYVVLALVFLITVGSLGFALQKNTERTNYVHRESESLLATMPKGDPSAYQQQEIEKVNNRINQEESNQQNFITILMGVFQAGTGAILGLLTGRVTAAK